MANFMMIAGPGSPLPAAPAAAGGPARPSGTDCPVRSGQHLVGSRLALLICSLLWLAAPRAAASSGDHSRRPSRPRTGSPAGLDSLAVRLHENDAPTVHEAIDAIARVRHPRSVKLLASFLRSGQPDDLCDHALQALGSLALPDAIEVLAGFTRHRRPEARKKAYLSLSRIPDARIPSLLSTGLRDADASVRGATALALGASDARQTLELLFRAFEQGVPEAAVAIGQLADDGGALRFNSYLGRESLPVMLSGYEQLLGRRDIAEKTKLAVVAALGELCDRVFSGAYGQPAPGPSAGKSPADGNRTRPVAGDGGGGRAQEPATVEDAAAGTTGEPGSEEPLPGRQIGRFLQSFLASGGPGKQEALERLVRDTILRIGRRRDREAGD